MRTALVLLAGTAFAISVLYAAIHAAGTPWAVPVALVAVGVAFLSDWLSERRPGLSSLERFERRERRRSA